VSGRHLVHDGHHHAEGEIKASFARAMRELRAKA